MARLGDVDAATKSLSDMQRRRHPAFTFVEADRMLAVSWAAAARGATTQAIADARRAADFARTHGQLAREVVCLQIATQFGDKSTAARLMQLKALVEGPRVEAAATYAAALAAADGDALRAASAEFEAMGDMLGAADAAAHAAITYRRAGRRGSALSAAARALRISVECGGATSPAVREAARPLPITAREREVVSLIAQGLSNRQIADALGTSIRTVEGHVYRACRRLDVKDRAALADLLEDSDLA